jgi:selenocysteine lyase/cysteine desulfurase
VEDFVNAYPKKIRFAVFDHIISTPGVVMPVDTLQEFFEEKGIPLFIDGAHAVNQLHLDMQEINPAAYFSNFHKWGFAPKNAAFLYISDKFLTTIKPALTGNNYGLGPAKEYFWTGTRDYTSYLCVRKGIEYSESFGPNKVMNYNHSLILAAAKRVA